MPNKQTEYAFALRFEVAAVGARDYRNTLIRIPNAQRNDPRRFVTHADEKSACVSETGSIDVTTTDISLVVDSVKRCKGRPGIVESEEIVWRDKEESVSRACGVRI